MGILSNMKMKSHVQSWLIFVMLTFVLVACGTSTPALTPDTISQGKQVFVRSCAQCHGENAEGYANELAALALNSTEHASHHPDQQIHDWIVNGKLGLGQPMPPLGEALTDGEVHAVIAYLHTLWTPQQLEVQQSLTSRWPSTPEPTWTPEP